MREQRRLRKLAEKIESQHWNTVMKNRRMAGLNPYFALVVNILTV